MNSFRVHLSAPVPDGPTPYLLLGSAGSGRVLMDFSTLEAEPIRRIPSLTLSLQGLYDVIQGQPLSLIREDGMVTLCQEGDEMVIECTEKGQLHRYRVWLAEVALGWNMLWGFTSSGIYLA